MHNPYSLFSGKTILIVDDSYISNSIVRTMLERNGVKVIIAQNGEEAFNRFCESSEFSINAILMDLAMPVMDGFESCKKIRDLARKDAKAIPIVAITANEEEFYRQKCEESGMTDFLEKPLDPNRLLQILSLYLE